MKTPFSPDLAQRSHSDSTPKRPPPRCASTNPARSTGVAFFAGGWAVGQLWLFWIAPIAGAALADLTYRELFGKAATVGIVKPQDLHASTR
jgi:hypothetical protein